LARGDTFQVGERRETIEGAGIKPEDTVRFYARKANQSGWGSFAGTPDPTADQLSQLLQDKAGKALAYGEGR
jgi:hypothetical protein